MPDVSVVIPTFRRAGLLKEAIQSALLQEGVETEVIVVDDSPEGSAREVVEGFADPRVTYTRCEPPSRGRPALVRNAGWPKAQGRFVHFLDDDDRVAAGFYRAAVQAFLANPDRGVVFGRIEPFADQEAPTMAGEREFFVDAARRARLAARVPSKLWMVANLLFRRTVLVNSACMIRKACIPTLEGYRVDIPLNEDVDFFCRGIRAFGFVFLDQVVVHYRIIPDSLMHGQRDKAKIIDSYQLMYERYRRAHGALELLALKLLARTVMRAS